MAESEKVSLERMLVQLAASASWLRCISDPGMRSTILTEDWPQRISEFYEQQLDNEKLADGLLTAVRHAIARNAPARAGSHAAASFSELVISSHRSAMFALGLRLCLMDSRLKSFPAADIDAWADIWDSAAEGIVHVLEGIDYEAVEAEVRCEIRRIPDCDFPEWSRPRLPGEWCETLGISLATFARRRKDGTYREHPASDSKNIRLLMADLPADYSG